MRSDYSLYGLGIIFFVAAGACLILLTGDQRSLTAVSTIVLALLSIGLGYSQRPKKTIGATTSAPTQNQSTAPTVQSETPQAAANQTMTSAEIKTEPTHAQIPKGEAEIIVAPVTAIQEQPKIEMQPLMEIPIKTEQAVQTEPVIPNPPAVVTVELIKIKGIKEKRAAQLGSFGIANANDLAKSSANDIADKLKISPKIVEKWIADAKHLTGTE